MGCILVIFLCLWIINVKFTNFGFLNFGFSDWLILIQNNHNYHWNFSKITFTSIVPFDSMLIHQKPHSISRAASQRHGILRKSWQVFHDRLLLGRCLEFCPFWSACNSLQSWKSHNFFCCSWKCLAAEKPLQVYQVKVQGKENIVCALNDLGSPKVNLFIWPLM